MREKGTSAADPVQLLRVKTLEEALRGKSPGNHHSSETTVDHTPPLTADSENLLPVEKAYFEQIIQNAPEAISIVDKEHRILRINGEFTRLFGFTPAEATGKTLDRLIVPPDRYAETAWIRQSIEDGKKLALETRRQKKDGALVEVLVSTAPVILEGQAIGAYASYRDIADQKRAEDLNAALYAIAARSQCAEDLQQFYAAIHNIVGQLMYARNFYIAIYDPQSQLLSFPVFC